MRRNLQTEQLKRLINLSMQSGYGAASKPIANLSTFKLRKLQEKIGGVLDAGESRIDPYSLAHLSDAQTRIEQALDAQYIRNLDDIRIRFSMPRFFGEPDSE